MRSYSTRANYNNLSDIFNITLQTGAVATKGAHQNCSRQHSEPKKVTLSKHKM